MTDEQDKKRGYTMSEKALEQRRAASQAAVDQGAHTGPLTEEGKAASSRNAWKHGEYSQATAMWKELGAIGAVGTPCRSTCPKHPDQNPQHPCTLVLDGLTKPGGDCLDRSVYVQAFDDIMENLHTGKLEAVHGMLASQVANLVEVLNMLRSAIHENGVLIDKPLTNKSGEIIGHVKVINPAIDRFNKMANDAGFSLPELMATPRQVKKHEAKEKETRTLQDMMHGVLTRFGGQPGGRTYDQDPEGVDADEDVE